jgi:hypothetical protein
VLILKIVKIVCFVTLLQVLILKGVAGSAVLGSVQSSDVPFRNKKAAELLPQGQTER